MSLDEHWNQVLLALREDLGPQDTDIWLKGSEAVRLDGDTLVIRVRDAFYADWIVENFRSPIVARVSQAFKRRCDIAFTYPDEQKEEPAIEEVEEPPPAEDSIPVEAQNPGLNRKQTFETFVVGSCNMFAHASAQAVADNPARTYNPLYIYGGTGLGKTHLMHAIGNAMVQRDPSARAVYVTAEEFMNEMVNSIRFKRTEEFRAKYRRDADVLLVDDIQFLSGKERTQEEFFFTFNSLQSSGKQIVLTSDMAPRDIKALEPRLRTRFEGGLIADVHAPDRETLIAILRQKGDAYHINMPGDLADAIAGAVQGNIRELEGIINRLAAMTRVYNAPLTLDFARRHMPNVFAPVPTNVTVPGIIEAVARTHNIRSADITGNKRTRALTRPRHIAMYLARKHTSLSFPELGREFGGRDHSTIQHGCKKIEHECPSNTELSYQIELVEQSLGIRTI